MKLLTDFQRTRKETPLMGDTSSETIMDKSGPDSKEFSHFGDNSFSPAKLNQVFQGDYKLSIGKVPRKQHFCSNEKSFYWLIVAFTLKWTILLAFFIYYTILPEVNTAKNSKYIIIQMATVVQNHTKNSQSESTTELPFPPKPDYNVCKLLDTIDRFDCFPEYGANQEKCEMRGCCWLPTSAIFKNNITNNIQLNTPYCFYPSNYNKYSFTNISEVAFGIEAILQRQYRSPYPVDVKTLKMTFRFETKDRLRIKVEDATQKRFEPPYPEIPIVDKATFNRSYELKLNISSFQVLRKSDNTIIFDSNNFLNFIYANQFIQMSTRLPSNFIYGLGEQQSTFMLSTNWTRNILFNHDAIPNFNTNLYGSHPFYMIIEKSGNSHGVFLLNSNAMEVILQPTPAITFRTIGGILDFYFFLGPSPEDVIRQYTDVIGKPHMPPYWGLGFHLCRFGYKTLNETKKVMQRNIDAGIPLDTQWNDLDYMNNSNDFTYDKENFRGLPEFVKDLHSKGMHYIPLIDPGISAGENPGAYFPYDTGVKMNIFIKNSTDQIFIGKVWNRASTVWPDFTNPTTVDYWTLMLKDYHRKVEFDGAWIDMNEPSNFLSGQLDGCPNTVLDNPPYTPRVDGGLLYYKTVCMSAKHYVGDHYNVHNLYGISEAIITNFALSEIRGKRPMIISRSTFAGLGRYAGHWSGDVWSRWLDMRYTIPQLLSFSIYGIPLMGADICGFNGNTTQSLCNRWMQLGAFYPFSRNHNTDDGIDQDPVAMGEQVVESSKKALKIRYSLLPYLYTLFHGAHVTGSTVARPLFFEFIEDRNTYSIDTQFLWGQAVMIVPVLEENAVSVNGYLPSGIWYDFFNSKSTIRSSGGYYKLSAPLDTIPILIRGGFVLPQQAPKQTTKESRNSKIQLLVALNEVGKAYGKLYWDDGDSLNTYEEKRYSLFSFELENNVLRCSSVFLGPEVPPNLGAVTILGINQSVTKVIINNFEQAFKYDTLNKFLFVENLDISFQKPIVFTWRY